eukprot:GILK01002480.1.p1 GENE.GILK01002480.1~~GILK01002480.1.p1  ORF type:complete len:612 (-),score=125.84 GILK01002480.1:1751-3586(-)
MSFLRSAMSSSLSRLRGLLKQQNLHAYIVPSEDAHLSEYTSDRDHRIAFISGFTGSAGTVVVAEQDAYLWTDGRYFLQAEKQLSAEWTLQKMLPDVPPYEEWLASNLPKNSRVGCDPFLVSLATSRKIKDALSKKGHELVPLTPNLIDSVWEDQPPAPKSTVFLHPVQYSGQSTVDKLASIRSKLKEGNAFGLVVSALDEIAWLYNIRGSDVSFNPVTIAYAFVSLDSAVLYVDGSRVPGDAVSALANEGVEIKPYDAIIADLTDVGNQSDKTVWFDPSRSNLALFNCLHAERVLEKASPIVMAKALKNEVELQGMRNCHLRDGAALIKFLSWLEAEISAGRQDLTECSVATKLEQFRSEQPDFVSLSFSTISSSGPNAAVIHYSPQPDSCAQVNDRSIFLLDSGGQYRDGTTDVTRTMHFGQPTVWERRCFTAVLQGNLQLERTTFPQGTTGYLLDPLARTPLWGLGLDFRHGTGHGVGSFLNVHEGPQGIGKRKESDLIPLEPGMTVTNEPGYYEDGAFGIRIENVMLVRQVQLERDFGGKGFRGFENITMVPIQKKMVDLDMLSDLELNQLNKYHAEVLAKISPLLQGSDNAQALAWLKEATTPMSRN